jgi:hypothetical protein
MSFTSKTLGSLTAGLRSRWSNRLPIGTAAGARVVRGARVVGVIRFLLSLTPVAGLRDRPGASVLRELGVTGEGAGHSFDFADVHPGIESSRLRALQTGQAWRGS